MSMTELCKELKNWFDRGQPKYFGTVVISGSTLSGKVSLQNGQYFRIVGSVFNDGVFRYPCSLHDETFDGAIWAMTVPPDVIALSEEIDKWKAKYGDIDSATMSPFQSESFGGYSYSKGAISRSADGSGAINPNSWQAVFADRLKLWRKAR